MRSLKPNLKKIKLNKKPAIAFLVALLLLGLGAGAYVYNNRQAGNNLSLAECGKLREEAKQLLKQQKYAESYAKLQPHSRVCAKPLSDDEIKDQAKTGQVVEAAFFSAEAAKAAFLSGDKEQAKQYAEQAASMVQKMSQEQRDTIPQGERLSLYSDIYLVRDGDYKPYMVERN